jgi:hypothetical protein
MRCGKVFAGMENFDLWSQLAALGQVIAIDLVLAGDNAIVVGMAAAGVPLEQRRKVIFWGVGAAIVLRIFFALITTQLLAIIGLTLAGGVLLLWVCWKMFRELRSHGQDEVAPDEALEAGQHDRAPAAQALLDRLGRPADHHLCGARHDLARQPGGAPAHHAALLSIQVSELERQSHPHRRELGHSGVRSHG